MFLEMTMILYCNLIALYHATFLPTFEGSRIKLKMKDLFSLKVNLKQLNLDSIGLVVLSHLHD